MRKLIVLGMVCSFLFVGCSGIVKFNTKTADDVVGFTKDTMGTIQKYLVSWPMYSGIIDGIDPSFKDWLPEKFWEAKEILDELSNHCPSLKDPPEDSCDFSDWNPSVIIPPEVNFKAYVILDGGILYYPELGPKLVFDKGAKKNEYLTGYAVGDATILASSIIQKVLKEFAPFSPELADILKIIPVLAL